MRRVARELLPLAAADLRYCSPNPRSRAAGEGLGCAPLAQLALRDCDMGRRRGLILGEATVREPEVVDAWLADPRAAVTEAAARTRRDRETTRRVSGAAAG